MDALTWLDDLATGATNFIKPPPPMPPPPPKGLFMGLSPMMLGFIALVLFFTFKK